MPQKTPKIKKIKLELRTTLTKEEKEVIEKLFDKTKKLSPVEERAIKKKIKDIEVTNSKVLTAMVKAMVKEINKYPNQARYIVPNIVTLLPKVLFSSLDSTTDTSFHLTKDERKIIGQMLKNLGNEIMPEELRYIG